MDFNYSETQRLLHDSATRYLTERFTLDHRRALRDSADGLDHGAWAKFAELGWLALAVPEALGGFGGSAADVAVLSAALGGQLVTEPFASTAVFAVHVLANAASPPAEALEAIAAGEARYALAHDEPGERYDYAGARKTRLVRNGANLVLTGQKMMAIDAPAANRLIVTAQDEDGVFALLVVDAAAQGAVQAPYPLVDGSRAADVAFDGVIVEPGAVLARGEAARRLFDEALDRTVLSLLAQAVGSLEAMLPLCARYLKERHQFGQAIGSFQSLQHMMADMFVATHQARSALYQALAHSDGSPAERARAVSLAKLTVGDASQLVSRNAIQLHGGYGVTDEFEVSHHFRRLMVIEKLFGDLDFHTRRLAAL
jgi:alkylation response protein AidB-like acyl-CoA dehydrogenase